MAGAHGHAPLRNEIHFGQEEDGSRAHNRLNSLIALERKSEKRRKSVTRSSSRKSPSGKPTPAASMLDVNGGLPGQEMEVLPWLVNIVQETVSIPLCLDSADPAVLRRALPLCKQRAMINSITDEPARHQACFLF